MVGKVGLLRVSLELNRKRGLLGGLARTLFSNITPGKLRVVTGALIGAAMIAPFLPGALVPSKRPEELEDIYSGRQLVPIKRGKYWEFGRSAWEGQGIDRYVPSWNIRLLSNARDIDIYGADLPAIAKFYKENFTYDIEERNYWRTTISNYWYSLREYSSYWTIPWSYYW